MSTHNGTDYDYKVGEIVQSMIDEGCEEILVKKDQNGGWDVTGDEKLFWRLATPSEIESINEVKGLKAKNKNHIEAVLKMQDDLIHVRKELDKYKTLYEHSEKCFMDIYESHKSLELQLNKLRE